MNQSEWWFRISVDAQSAATLRYSSAKSRQRSARYSGSDMIPPKDKTVPDSAEVGARKPLVRPQRGKSVGQVLVPGLSYQTFASDSWAPVTCSRVSDPVHPGEISKRRRGPEGTITPKKPVSPTVRGRPIGKRSVGNDDPSLPQTARSRPHRMAGIRSIGGGRPRRRGLLSREWMDPSASPRGVGLGMALGSWPNGTRRVRRHPLGESCRSG